MVLVWLLVSVAFVVGPYVLPVLLPGAPISGASQAIMTSFGVILLATGGVILIITKLYQKTAANEALVRTGMGGRKVIVDGGVLFIPVIHRLLRIPLDTMRLDVVREGSDALITMDYLRADLKAEFYIKVEAEDADIVNASRSLGERSMQSEAVKQLVFDKLVSALRTVAANKSLDQLNTKRDEFAEEVQKIVMIDLKHNGLTLETVTISKLDQTDKSLFNEGNVFDAQGLKRMTEITQAALVAKNELERAAERAITGKDVETRKAVLDMQRDQAEAEATQAMEVAKVRAGRDREAAEFAISQDEEVEKRKVEKARAVQAATIQAQKRLVAEAQEKEIAEVTKAQTIETADREKQRAIIEAEQAMKVAAVTRDRAVEVAQRDQQVAIALKEKERADAEAKRLAAEAERERQVQAVKTVEVAETAKRDKDKAVIGAQAEIEKSRLQQQMKAEVEAYSVVKVAEGRREAAKAESEARLKLAEADALAAVKRAEGEQAGKMVDVNVEREKVAVEGTRVEVERQELENKQTYSAAALEFEVQKLRIEADREVRIAAAKALGEVLGKGVINLFGTPEMMNRVVEPFVKGFGLAQWVEGADTASHGRLSELAKEGAEAIGSLLKEKGSDPAR